MDTLLLASRPAGTPDSAVDVAVDAARGVLAGDGAVEVAELGSREQLDAALDGRAGRRLVLAGDDAGLHVLVKRLWRRGELADVPVGIVPLAGTNDFARYLGLPPDPGEAAEVALAGKHRRLDLLRSDGGDGVVVNAVRLGKAASRPGLLASLLGPRGWPLHVNVDDQVLADGTSRLSVVAIGNGSHVGGTRVFPDADAGDGALDVLVLGPGRSGATTGTGGQGFRLIRRARGRAVSVTPAPGVEVEVHADGELGSLSGRRSWWIEPSAWSAYR